MLIHQLLDDLDRDALIDLFGLSAVTEVEAALAFLAKVHQGGDAP